MQGPDSDTNICEIGTIGQSGLRQNHSHPGKILKVNIKAKVERTHQRSHSAGQLCSQTEHFPSARRPLEITHTQTPTPEIPVKPHTSAAKPFPVSVSQDLRSAGICLISLCTTRRLKLTGGPPISIPLSLSTSLTGSLFGSLFIRMATSVKQASKHSTCCTIRCNCRPKFRR